MGTQLGTFQSRISRSGQVSDRPISYIRSFLLTKELYNDKIAGNNQNNALQGLYGNDEILGRQRNDTLVGGNGNNILQGGEGNDIFMGSGNEKDRLIGGKGRDTFVIDRPSIFQNDRFATIKDFGTGNDQVQLQGLRQDYSLETRAGSITIYLNGTDNSKHAIAYIEGVTKLSLTNSGQFTFTPITV